MEAMTSSLSSSLGSSRRSVTGPTRTSGVAPIPLDDLTRRIAELWGREPFVHPSRRTELLTELHELERQVERLALRSDHGRHVPAHLVRHCAERYLWLREQWGGDDDVAA